MEKNTGNGKKTSWAAIFGVASVWFGTHVGSGFATGTQGLSFFAQYGWTALLFPALSMLVVVGVHMVGMNSAVNFGLENGRQWANNLFHPYEKLFGSIYEVIAFLCGVLAVSACLAGSGSLLKGWIGLPYFAGVFLTGVALVLVAIFGVQLITAVSGLLSAVMIVFLLLLFFLGIKNNAANLTSILSNRTMFNDFSFGQAAWKAVTYACFQATTVTTMVAVNGEYKNKGDIRRYAVVGFIMNAVMLTLSCLTVLSGMPGTQNELPILTICGGLNFPWITAVYRIILYCAFLSTGATIIYGTVKRWSAFFKKPADPFQKKLTIAVGYFIINVLVAQLGLIPLINRGYAYMGTISLFLYVIPSFTAGIIKNRRYEERKRAEAADTKAA